MVLPQRSRGVCTQSYRIHRDTIATVLFKVGRDNRGLDSHNRGYSKDHVNFPPIKLGET